MIRPRGSRERISSAGRMVVLPEGYHLLGMSWKRTVGDVHQRNTPRQGKLIHLELHSPANSSERNCGLQLVEPSFPKRSFFPADVRSVPTNLPFCAAPLPTRPLLTNSNKIPITVFEQHVTDCPAGDIRNQLSKREDVAKWALGLIQVEMYKRVETVQDDGGVKCSRTKCESHCKGKM
jgi:hypothetical protein